MKKPPPFFGTSGWTYDHGKGVFYPESLRRREWLLFYARRFAAVELNASFYRIPLSETTGYSCRERS